MAKTADIFGVFHSHPIGEADPSDDDIAAGPRDGHAIIYDLIGDQFRLWRVARYKWDLVKCFDFDRSWLMDTSDD